MSRLTMLIMMSNATGIEIGLLAVKYPGRIGHLFSPGAQRGPWAEIPYALDNGAWPAFLNGIEWSEEEWLALLRWAALSGILPRWALVADVVGDRDGTLRAWDRYEAVVRGFGFRRAFAVQDGMTFGDVPDDDCMLFIGGSDKFKDAAIAPWCARFPGRVHVGRVTGWDRLVRSWRAGAVSVDGNGWYRKGRSATNSQANDLRKFLRETEVKMVTIAKRFTFDAAHRLDLPTDHKCSRLHGHTYEVELRVRGELDARGFVVDYEEIAAAFAPVHDELDHRYLNDVPGLEQPSTEVLVRWIAERLRGKIRGLVGVRVAESSTTWAEIDV